MPRKMTPSKSRCRRSIEKGSIAVEGAYSLMAITFVLVAGISFGHAMVVRHQLSNAASRAVRFCAVQGTPTPACLDTQVRAGLGPTAMACEPLNIQPGQPIPLGPSGLFAIQVELTCAYVGTPGARLLSQLGVDRLVLRATAAMPVT